MAEITRLSYAQLGDRLMAAGALTPEELTLTFDGLQSSSFFGTGILTVAVWGRRPNA
jgi:hypothetical protein